MTAVDTPAVFRKSGGFTLVEVILSLGIISVIMVVLIGLCMTVVTMNKRVEQRVSAMNLVDAQLNELLAATSGELSSMSPAKAFLQGMRDKIKYLDSISRPDGFPYSVTLDANAGTLVYEFMIPVPGRRRLGIDAPVEDIMSIENREVLARGVAVVYLRENAVPPHFLEWADLRESGTPTRWPNNWFPMSGPGSTGTGNYMNLLTSPDPDWEGSELQNLPLMLSVRYYDDANHMARDDIPRTLTQGNIIEHGTSSVSASRMYLVTSNRFAL